MKNCHEELLLVHQVSAGKVVCRGELASIARKYASRLDGIASYRSLTVIQMSIYGSNLSQLGTDMPWTTPWTPPWLQLDSDQAGLYFTESNKEPADYEDNVRLVLPFGIGSMS